MFDIIISNFGFWINFLIPVAVAIFLLISHKEFVTKEFFMQFGITIIYTLTMFFLLFSFSTDLVDREYWNGKVSKFVWEEEWTEEVTYYEEVCTGSGEKRSCHTVTKTRNEYHPNYYYIKTSNGERISISSSEWRTASREFGKKKNFLYRMNQVSYGDGNEFISTPNIVIPTSVSHSYNNYVVASKLNVLNENVSKKELDILVLNKLLPEPPKLYEGEYGETKLNRIIDMTNSFDTSKMLKELDLFSAKYGKEKQVNPIIVITNQGREFKRNLAAYWKNAEKNEAVLLLGVNGSKIVWSDVITWTKEMRFVEILKSSFKDLDLKKDSDKVLNIFTKNIIKEYVRQPMEDFAYLKENITLKWYWQLFIILGNLVLSFFSLRYFLTNRNF